jgi:histidine triad (HIT) family protein
VSDSIFAKIIRREAPADIVHEDEHSVAFHDIKPAAPVHILIVPKKPIATLEDVQEDDLPLIGHIHRVAQHLAKAYELEGWKLQVNVGEKGGQVVFHLHYHLLGWPKESKE